MFKFLAKVKPYAYDISLIGTMGFIICDHYNVFDGLYPPFKVPEGATLFDANKYYSHRYSNRRIILPDGIKKVKFGDRFNRDITLPSSLEEVRFGRDFNQPVTLPDNLETIKFGDLFNQQVTLPEGIKFVWFGDSFNQQTTLPNSIKFVFAAKRAIPKISIADGHEVVVI